MSSEYTVVVSAIKSAPESPFCLQRVTFRGSDFQASNTFRYQLHSQLSSPFQLDSLCRINFIFYYSFGNPTSSALFALSRGWIFQKAIFFTSFRWRKLFALNSGSFNTGWCVVLFCFHFGVLFSANTKNFHSVEENFNVFPTNTGATFRRAEILFAAACFFLPFQIVNRFFSGENLICLFRHYSVYFSPHRSARLKFNSITQN